ncbi:MAG: hypothetical protein QT02_C0001G0035 [archaeon GW2011_AR9]|nr:MAG: hypothetical protein QT02_C0001G0035 [archaeon GW2011_AR9]
MDELIGYIFASQLSPPSERQEPIISYHFDYKHSESKLGRSCSIDHLSHFLHF